MRGLPEGSRRTYSRRCTRDGGTAPMSIPRSSTIRDLDISVGAREVPDRATFETLARRDDVPGQLAAPEMKLLILGVDSPAPQLYFLNTNAFQYHYDFATRAL